jgi:hypothetical protein
MLSNLQITASFAVLVSRFCYLRSKLHSIVIMQGCKLDKHINLLTSPVLLVVFQVLCVFSKSLQILFASLLP